MNNVRSKMTAHEQREIEAWCAEVRAAHAQSSQPIHEGEPRFDRLVESRSADVSRSAPEERGESYFAELRGALPPWPLALPEWVVKTEIHAGTYPETVVEFYGRSWTTSGGLMARVEQMRTVFVDDFVDSQGRINRRHEMIVGEAQVFVLKHAEDLSADEAFELAVAIENAAMELSLHGNES